MEVETLKKVQQTVDEILLVIDRQAKACGVPYYLFYGSALGAIRHHGFIPWDDDADIAFTRNNYEAFLKVVRRELPDTMELLMPEDFQGGRAFFDFTARVIYKNSRRHEDSPEVQYYEGKLNHLWVDLFIIDELPQSKAAAGFTRLLHKSIYLLAMGHRYHLDFSKYSLFHKLAVGGGSAVGRLVPMKLIFKMQHAAALKDKHGRSSLRYYSNYQPDYLYVTIQKEWCEEITDIEFEGETLMASKYAHEVLTWVYGDYMKLPPEAERVPAHSTIDIQVFDEEA